MDWVVTLLIALFALVVIATPLIAVWLHAAVTEHGRRTADDWHLRHEARRERRRALSTAAEQARIERDATETRRAQLLQLEGQRVGQRFRWRARPDDIGMIGTVES